jgi:hypothetical protein
MEQVIFRFFAYEFEKSTMAVLTDQYSWADDRQFNDSRHFKTPIIYGWTQQAKTQESTRFSRQINRM